MRHRRSVLSPSLFLAVALGASACGHPATDAECGEILGRIVDLELRAQNVTDPAELARRKQATLSEQDGGLGSLRGACVGKRVTDGVLACVRAAKTSEEITESCLR